MKRVSGVTCPCCKLPTVSGILGPGERASLSSPEYGGGVDSFDTVCACIEYLEQVPRLLDKYTEVLKENIMVEPPC